MKKTRIKKIEEKILPTLPAMDRLKMVLKANAAGEEEAADRLLNACPEENYRTREVRFKFKAREAYFFQNEMRIIIERAAYALEVLEVLRPFMDPPGKPAKGRTAKEKTLLFFLRRNVLRDFQVTWAAYDKYSREKYDLPATDMLSAWNKGDQPEILEYMINEDVDLGEEDREEITKMAESIKKEFTEIAASIESYGPAIGRSNDRGQTN